MRAIIQRVKKSWVSVDGEIVGETGAGLLVFLGVARDDHEKDADRLVEKIVNLRIFQDNHGQDKNGQDKHDPDKHDPDKRDPDKHEKMNLSLLDTRGQMLVVSQFTLLGDCRKGRRPSFMAAAEPKKAKTLYDHFVEKSSGKGIAVETGVFQAMMDVGLVNDGPVTFILESRRD